MGETSFPVGVHRLHADRSLDFQLNRLVTLGGGRLDEVREIASRIVDLEDWKREMLGLAERALREERKGHGAAYLRAAEFFMAPDDPDKSVAYEQQAKLFFDLTADDRASGALEERSVPYAIGRLPVWRLRVPDGVAKKGVVVVHGGFDSYAEELYALVRRVPAHGWETILFEGPGQGSVIRQQGIPFTAEWEDPVRAVLDSLALDDVTLVGISLGGYLAPRAAAFLPQIRRVVAFDVCWDLFEAGLSTRPWPMRVALRTLLGLRAGSLLDALVALQMRRDPFVRWAVEHGCFVFGKDRPYDYLRRMRDFSMRGISASVRQDFLLMAGAEDHYMPVEHFHRQAQALVNVRSFTGRLFTRADHAHTHCQCGNLDLALRTMLDWIDERTAAAAP